MKKYLFLFLVLGLAFQACKKEKVLVDEIQTSTSTGVEFGSNDGSEKEEKGFTPSKQKIPSYSSFENFRNVYNSLREKHEEFLDNIEEKYPDVSAEEYDNLIDQSIIQEWKVLEDFSDSRSYNSLLKNDLIIENNWLDNGAIIDEAPNEIIIDEVLKAMINTDGNVEIDGKIVNLCDDGLDVQQRGDWCTPYGTRHKYFEEGNHRIRVSGGIGFPNFILGSFITEKIVAYKKNWRGKWRRHRQLLTIGATCNVRRSPLNNCKMLNAPAVTGFKSKKRRSLSVTKFNWLNAQIWYKKPFNNNPDGLVNANSEHIGVTIGF